MKTIKKAVNVSLGNIDIDTIAKQTSTLIESDNNQAEIFKRWNKDLTVNNKWYNFTPMKLPVEFIENTKKVIAIEFFNQPENNNLLGYYIEVDGKSKRLDEKQMKKLDNTTNVFHLTLDTVIANAKPSKKMKASNEFIAGVNRKFSKDKWDKKIVKWQKDAKQIDDTGEVEKKEKAHREFLQMLTWNMIGNPDEFSTIGYSGSFVRKCINDKNGTIDADKFEKLCEKFIEDATKLS